VEHVAPETLDRSLEDMPEMIEIHRLCEPGMLRHDFGRLARSRPPMPR
jgi:hypothetical protein